MWSRSSKPLAWIVPIMVEAAVFARSILFARLIGAEELGQAMLLALTLRLVEMASDVGVERMLARAAKAEVAPLQAQLHAVTLLRGVAMALLLLVIAGPLAVIYTDGPALSGYLILALVPLIRGGVHLDYRRRERDFDYRGLAVVEGGSIMVMLAAGGVAAIGGDHTAMLVAVVAQALAQLFLSHLIADTPYRLCFQRAGLCRAWQFGAPLIINAVLMFITMQGDRLIVAGAFGWVEVAVYGVALQLALLPAQIVGRASASLLAPRLRQAIERRREEVVIRDALLKHGLFALIFLPFYVGLAAAVIAGLYGPEFAPSQMLIAGLGAAAALRIARTPLSLLSIALGRTDDPARANLWRATALFPILLTAGTGGPLALIAWAGAAGEALAFLAAWRRLSAAGHCLVTPNREVCP